MSSLMSFRCATNRNAWRLLWSDSSITGHTISPLPRSTLLDLIYNRLEGLSDSVRLDAQVLLAHVLKRSRAWVLAHPEVVLTPAQSADLDLKLLRLQQGEPLPYVLGEWEFYGLRFLLTPAVLIPRPETELLVESALAWLKSSPTHRLALDVGTGSGCIAVALAAHIPDLKLVAVDCSSSALSVAAENIRLNQVEGRVELVQADLFPDLPLENLPVQQFHTGVITASFPRFDLICANLPYIPTAVLSGLPVARSEPSLALDGGPDGLDLIRRLLSLSPSRITLGGLILIEIESGQGPLAKSIASSHFQDAEVELIADLAGKDRLIKIQT